MKIGNRFSLSLLPALISLKSTHSPQLLANPSPLLAFLLRHDCQSSVNRASRSRIMITPILLRACHAQRLIVERTNLLIVAPWVHAPWVESFNLKLYEIGVYIQFIDVNQFPIGHRGTAWASEKTDERSGTRERCKRFEPISKQTGVWPSILCSSGPQWNILSCFLLQPYFKWQI